MFQIWFFLRHSIIHCVKIENRMSAFSVYFIFHSCFFFDREKVREYLFFLFTLYFTPFWFLIEKGSGNISIRIVHELNNLVVAVIFILLSDKNVNLKLHCNFLSANPPRLQITLLRDKTDTRVTPKVNNQQTFTVLSMWLLHLYFWIWGKFR